MKLPLTAVRYVKLCPVPGGTGWHIVFDTGHGPATLLLMPQSRERTAATRIITASRIEISTRRLANEQLAGTYTSVVKGQGLAFREVRQYQAGDDVRTIDWNVSARMDETDVKVFVEEPEMTVMLVVDLSLSQSFGTRRAPKSRVAAEVSALCAFSAIRNNDRVGPILASDGVDKIIAPNKGEKHGMRVVREVLGFEPERPGTDLKGALEALIHVARRRTVTFVVSDFFAHVLIRRIFARRL